MTFMEKSQLSLRESLGEYDHGKSTDAPWLAELRKSAFARFQSLGWPTRKWEAWKYMNLEPILNTYWETKPPASQNVLEKASSETQALWPEGEPRLLFYNGVFQAKLSSAPKTAGVHFQSLREAVRNQSALLLIHLGKKIKEEANPFVAMNTFSFEEGAFIYIPENVTSETPFHLVFLNQKHSGSPYMISPRILVVLEKGAKAKLIYHDGGEESDDFTNLVFEARIAEGASLEMMSVQAQPSRGRQFFNSRIYLSKSSVFSQTNFSGNRGLVRNDIQVDFEDENASCSLSGLSILSDQAQTFHHAVVNHAAPSCTSRQLYKSILADEAMTEFNSLSHVWPGAQKSDSNQLNRNLLLSEKARAYSRPQLQIYADDVAATHGSATGKLEDQELFYLQSRGLDRLTARYLLIKGFAEDVLNAISHQKIRERLLERVGKELQLILGEKG